MQMRCVLDHTSYNGVQIIQPFSRQRQNACGFMASAKHISYMFRLLHAGYQPAKAPAIQLPEAESLRNGMLIDAYLWQDKVLGPDPPKDWSFTIPALLGRAQSEGVPLADGSMIRIRSYNFIDKVGTGPLPVQEVHDALANHGCLVGVIPILKNYPVNADSVYEAIQGTELATHAVVLLGEYEKVVGEETDTYWLYEDFNGCHQDRPFCTNYVESKLLLEAYYVDVGDPLPAKWKLRETPGCGTYWYVINKFCTNIELHI